jgi:hypothetical protein
MEFWGANLRDFINPRIIRIGGGPGAGAVPGPDLDPVDQALIFFDIFEARELQNDIIRANPAHNNVHDHQIQESLRDSLNRLIKWYSSVSEEIKMSKEKTYRSIKEYLFLGKDQLDKKEKAYSTIRQIEKTDGLLESVNRTEGDILQMVWQRICDPINEEVKNYLKDNLLDLLSDSTIRIDTSYCLVGRITRMVQALQSLDKEGLVVIKSTEIIAGEIQAKIPVLRSEFFAQHPSLLNTYEEGNDIAAKQLTEFVRNGIYRDYPQANEDTKLKKIIEEHLEALD